MTRHATTARPSIAATPIPAAVCVHWTALIARNDLGRSSNSLDLGPATTDVPAASGGIRPEPCGPLRRIELSVRLEPVAGVSDRIRFSAEVAEDGHHRILEPAGIVPGTVAIVGDRVHFVVDGSAASAAGDEARWGAYEPLLIVVLGASGEAALVRGRVGGLAGLAAGALGLARVSTRRGPLPA